MKNLFYPLLFLVLLFTQCSKDDDPAPKVLQEVGTLAGNGEDLWSDGEALNASFSSPRKIRVSPYTIFVSEYNRIRSISDGVVMSVWLPPLEISWFNGNFYSISGISIDNDGMPMYVGWFLGGDIYGSAVFKEANSVPEYLARKTYYGNTNYLHSLAVGADGSAFVADTKIYKIDRDNQELVFFAGSAGFGFADGPADQAQFRRITDMVVDTEGNVYVADADNHRIRKITPSGEVSTLAGNSAAQLKDGKGSEASFSSPEGLAIDKSGNVYVADTGNHCIRMITPDGVVTTVAGTGEQGYQDGPASEALFNAPQGVAVDKDGRVLVADTGNHRIRFIK